VCLVSSTVLRGLSKCSNGIAVVFKRSLDRSRHIHQRDDPHFARCRVKTGTKTVIQNEPCLPNPQPRHGPHHICFLSEHYPHFQLTGVSIIVERSMISFLRHRVVKSVSNEQSVDDERPLNDGTLRVSAQTGHSSRFGRPRRLRLCGSYGTNSSILSISVETPRQVVIAWDEVEDACVKRVHCEHLCLRGEVIMMRVSLPQSGMAVK
jgi:hypothetical protein